MLAEGVDDRSVGVGHEDHVRLLDLLEAADRRAIEPVALVEPILGQLGDRHREVLGQAREIAKPEVDDLDAFILGQPENLGRASFLHRCLL